jgi:hypothetical protein
MFDYKKNGEEQVSHPIALQCSSRFLNSNSQTLETSRTKNVGPA